MSPPLSLSGASLCSTIEAQSLQNKRVSERHLPQRIVPARRTNHDLEKIGSHVHHRAHQQSAGGAAADREPVLRRELLAHQMSAAAIKSVNVFFLLSILP